MCAHLKTGDVQSLACFAQQLARECIEGCTLTTLFSTSTVLVPVPASTLTTTGLSCAAERLASALLQQGLGTAVWNGLARRLSVPKSATARAGNRPTVDQHLRSFALVGPPPATDRILLIDDVVTKGRTLLAAAGFLQQALPGAQIRAFALFRTLSLTAEIDGVLQPCVGEIRWRRRDAWRCP
jgi:predicted amidophosphoribosyltransferase